MLELLVQKPRRTPEAPVRLSYAEDATDSAAAVDGSNVDFDDEPTKEPGKGVSIVFAGDRYFDTWSTF